MEEEDGKKRRRRRYGENRAYVTGHVVDEPKSVGGRFVSVPILIPGYVKDGKRQWQRVAVDVFGEDMARVSGVKKGDYMRATCHMIPRKVRDDNGDTKTVVRLQANKTDGIGLLSAKIEDPYNPPDIGICRNEVAVVGTYIADKDRRGPDGPGPQLRGDKDRPMTFVRLVYNDPRAEDDDDDSGIWLDIGLFGKTAEIVSEHLRHLAVVYVAGEIGVREARFTVNGKAPTDLRISPRPWGFQFWKPEYGGGGGQRRESQASGPEPDAYGGEDEADLPF